LSNDYIEAAFSLAGQLLQYPSGGNCIITSGLISVMTQTLKVSNAKQFRVIYILIVSLLKVKKCYLQNITKFVTFLDNVLYGYANALTSFTSAGGIDSLVSRLKVRLV
jgi:hypothetical protein